MFFFFLGLWSVLGSLDHPIADLEIYGILAADGGSFNKTEVKESEVEVGDPGGGSGGTLLLFLQTLAMANGSSLSSAGGHGGPVGGGGGGGGRLHFHWVNIPTGVEFVPVANINGGIIHTRCSTTFLQEN